MDDATRFWTKVNVSGGPEACWPWIAGRFASGYGAFKRGDKIVRAHRVAYELYRGPVADGMHVLHSCDNPVCCNPRHLRVGTHGDNMRDRQARGLYPKGRRRMRPGKIRTEPPLEPDATYDHRLHPLPRSSK